MADGRFPYIPSFECLDQMGGSDNKYNLLGSPVILRVKAKKFPFPGMGESAGIYKLPLGDFFVIVLKVGSRC
jgi:hypothetical protein